MEAGGESVELRPYLDAVAEAVKVVDAMGRLWTPLLRWTEKASRRVADVLADGELRTAAELTHRDKDAGEDAEHTSPTRALLKLNRFLWFVVALSGFVFPSSSVPLSLLRFVYRVLLDVARLEASADHDAVFTVVRMAYHDTLETSLKFFIRKVRPDDSCERPRQSQ